MRKALLLAVAAAMAVAGIAYAANTNQYNVGASIKPTKSGTKKHPVTVSQLIGYFVSTASKTQNANVPTNVKSYSTVVQGIHENTNKFPACGTARLNSSTEGPSTCPKGSKVGSGFALVYQNPNNRPRTYHYAGTCRLELSIYNGGNHTLSFYFFKGANTHKHGPCPLPHNDAIVGTLTSNSGGYRDVFTIPNFLRTPIAGQTWTIFQIHTTIGPHKRTVTVHGKTKTFGLFYSYACPPNHFRQVKVTFKAVDGNSQTVTRNVACS